MLMQTTVLAEKDSKDEASAKEIADRVRKFAQDKAFEIEIFRISSEKVEDGISIEFEMRAVIKFKKNGS
jgi:hypothetical protein